MQVILFSLYDPAALDAVLEAWGALGLRAITILEGELTHHSDSPHVGARYSFGYAGSGGLANCCVLLLALAPAPTVVETCLQATERVVGSLADGSKGLFVAWEAGTVAGMAFEPANDGPGA